MSIQTIKQHRRWLVPAAIVLTVAGFAIAPLAFAKIMNNTIDPEAVVTDNGRRIILTGPMQIAPAGEKVFMRVTISQRSTGAVAEGNGVFTGTGDLQEWQIVAQTEGRPGFEPGEAVAVAIARTTDRNQVTDAHQWLVHITLVAQ